MEIIKVYVFNEFFSSTNMWLHFVLCLTKENKTYIMDRTFNDDTIKQAQEKLPSLIGKQVDPEEWTEFSLNRLISPNRCF